MWPEDGMFGREASLVSEGDHLKGFHAEGRTLAACSVYSDGGENSGWIDPGVLVDHPTLL